MKRIIHIYLNDKDLLEIVQLLNDNNYSFYTRKGDIVDYVPAISNTISCFYINHKGETICTNSNVMYTPCCYYSKYLQSGFFSIDNDNSNNLKPKNAFCLIYKHIKNSFILSQDKSYYIGPDIYRDWINKKLCLPVHFSYTEVIIDANDTSIEKFFAKLQNEGFKVITNNSKLKNMDKLDINAESFIIFKDTSKLSKTIIHKNTIRYEKESECVFVTKKKTKNCVQYSFVIDDRIKGEWITNLKNILKAESEGKD